MPAVTIARKGLTPSDISSALSKQLGNRYKVTERAGHPDRLKVATSATALAHVHVMERPDGTHFGVHGGGFIIGRVVNELLIARKVAAAIRQSPELGGAAA